MTHETKSLCALAIALGVSTSTRAYADDLTPVWHAEYGLGAAAGSTSGLRQNLDASGGVAFTHHSGQDLGGGDDGWLVGGAVVTGFHAYPTYLAVEGGWTSIHIFGFSATAGPALRLDPGVRPGGELAASIMFAYVRLGVRAIGVSDGDVQICGTLGVGVE
jgi:hypothetical protein